MKYPFGLLPLCCAIQANPSIFSLEFLPVKVTKIPLSPPSQKWENGTEDFGPYFFPFCPLEHRRHFALNTSFYYAFARIPMKILHVVVKQQYSTSPLSAVEFVDAPTVLTVLLSRMADQTLLIDDDKITLRAK